MSTIEGEGKERILKELESIVGSEYVSSSREITFLYHWDFVTAEKPGCCDFVVMPSSTEEVQEIVRLANREKIPVIPWVSGMNFGGICIPRKGGIVVDLRRMNKVLEVNEDDMYAVVEGGITWGDLKGYLEKHHPNLRAGITWSPAGTGVIPPYICYGMLDLGFIGGTGAEFINGLEVVLPTGEIVRVGSCICTNYWLGRAPLPDLVGLFIGWDGTTGIVTKAGIKLWPNLPRKDFIIIADTVDTGVKIFRKLAKAGLGIVDMCFLNYVWLCSLQGYQEDENIPFEPEKTGGNDFYGLITITAYTEKEMEAKSEAIMKIVEEEGGLVADIETVINMFSENERENLLTLTNPPIHFYGVWNFSRGGGGEWVGSYISSRHVAQYYEIARSIAKKYGKHACMYGRVMFGGHHWIARVNINFNKNDLEDVERARKCLMEIDENVRKLGSVIRYKAPPWAKKRNLEKANPTALELIRKIKRLLDPNGIMNPGHEI